MQFYYGAQSDGSVGLVHKFIWKGDAMEGDWYMDGKKTSGNMYETYYKKYHANATWYSFAQSSNKKRTFKYQTEIRNVISVWSLQDMNPFQA